MNKKEGRKFIRTLYELVPNFKCQKEGCFECCGPIPMMEVEYGLIKRAMRRMSKKHLMDRRRELKEGDLTCPLLDVSGKCMAYDVRPLICRLFGNTKVMKCPYKEYSEDEEKKLFDDDLRIFMRYRKSAKIYDLAKLIR